MGEEYEGSTSVPAKANGTIVSHNTFDEDDTSENYYPANTDVSLTLTGLAPNDTLRLTFRTFKLNYLITTRWVFWTRLICDDYLEISDIRGYNKITLCGYHDLTNHYIDLYPVKNQVAFRFVTEQQSWFGSDESTGFLISYEGLQYFS